MKDTLINRKDIYGFLASMYALELTTDTITEMRGKGIFDLLISAGLKFDINSLKGESISQVQEDLACEYTALFIGPGKHIYPFESAYVTGGNGRVRTYWSESTAEVKRILGSHGLEVTGKYESIPDHISVELEFMYKLIEKELEAWEKNDTDSAGRARSLERSFFENHLNNWVPQFCSTVIKHAQHDFYKEIARITQVFFREEKEVLQK